MKKLIALVVGILMLCSFAFAQDMPAGNKQGAKSLDFTFNGLGTFGLNNVGVSLTYFLSSDAAVRLGLNAQNVSTSQDPPSTVVGGQKAETSQLTVAVGADYLMYMSGASSRVRPYMGAGVGFGMTSGSEKNTTADEIKTGGIVLGVAGILGAEFYLYNEISLSAEYSLNLVTLVLPSDREVTNGGVTTKTPGVNQTTILGFGATGAALHIYF